MSRNLFLILSIILCNWFLCFSFDFNKLVEQSTIEPTKIYTDDEDVLEFLNGAVSNSIPASLDGYSKKILSLFNNWDEKYFFENNFLSAFAFANFFENDKLVGKINLKNFVEHTLQKSLSENEKNSKFHLSFQMPPFMSRQMYMPKVLQCQQLEDRFEDLVSL